LVSVLACAAPGATFNGMFGGPIGCSFPELGVSNPLTVLDARTGLGEKRPEPRRSRQQKALQIVIVGRSKQDRHGSTISGNHNGAGIPRLVQECAQLCFNLGQTHNSHVTNSSPAMNSRSLSFKPMAKTQTSRVLELNS
jgi:hypothetical protein